MSNSDDEFSWHKEIKNVKKIKKDIVTYLAPVKKFNTIDRPKPNKPFLMETNNHEINIIDQNIIKKIKKSHMPIDYTIDLHGLTQIQARNLLVDAVTKCFAKSYRVILIITGKGQNDEGILKKKFPEWINEHDIKPMIAGFSLSSQIHGGNGAYYLLLKKPKNSFTNLTFFFP